MSILEEFMARTISYLPLAGFLFLMACLRARFSKKRYGSNEMVNGFFETLSVFLIVLILDTFLINSFGWRILLFVILIIATRKWLMENQRKANWYYDRMEEKIKWLPKRN